MSANVITDATELRALCARLSGSPWLALDTEFMRVSTYRARLCLVQLATPDAIACVDPLAIGDLTPLFELLYAPTIVKVLHAARQDLEVFADLRGDVPRPVFDTQIAAALVGVDDQIGYAALVERLTGHKLAKIESRTDWAARPLTEAQIRYAEDDVRYLCDVYRALDAQLLERGRTGWLAEECESLTRPALYRNQPGEAWRRLGGGAMLAPPNQVVLVALAEWRERQAQQRDLPRGWVVPDAALVELARQLPDSLAALGRIEELKPSTIRRDGETLLKLILEARQAPATRYWEALDRLDAAQTATVKRLSNIVQEAASAAGISATLIAPKRELVRLVRGERDGALLHGWRRAVVGERLLAELERR